MAVAVGEPSARRRAAGNPSLDYAPAGTGWASRRHYPLHYIAGKPYELALDKDTGATVLAPVLQ